MHACMQAGLPDAPLPHQRACCRPSSHVRCVPISCAGPMLKDVGLDYPLSLADDVDVYEVSSWACAQALHSTSAMRASSTPHPQAAPHSLTLVLLPPYFPLL